MSKRKSIIILLPIIIVLCFISLSARATIVGNTDRFAEKASGNSDFTIVDSPSPAVIAANVIKWALTILAIIFFLLTIYAGYLWLTAGGNEDQVGEAKKKFVNAVIGLAIVLTAYAFTYMILEGVVGAVL